MSWIYNIDSPRVGDSGDDSPSRRYQCQHCGETVTDLLAAMHHWVTVHPGSSQWPQKKED